MVVCEVFVRVGAAGSCCDTMPATKAAAASEGLVGWGEEDADVPVVLDLRLLLALLCVEGVGPGR